jgi:hypothetical protein
METPRRCGLGCGSDAGESFPFVSQPYRGRDETSIRLVPEHRKGE